MNKMMKNLNKKDDKIEKKSQPKRMKKMVKNLN